MFFTVLIIVTFTGCGANNTPMPPSEETTNTTPGEISVPETTSTKHTTPQPNESVTPSSKAADPTVQPTEPTAIPVDTLPTERIDEYGLTEQQRNSFSMLYYLAITAEEIRISKDNRLLLDDIYTSLLNDINPGAIDETTQDHLKNLRHIIKAYISISVKRDRLQYIYNQDKAASIRSAVPNPLAILSMTSSFNWKKLAMSTVYTVVDSYNNFKSANEAADKEFLMSGWELDDEETAAIQKNRERAFDYMVDIVQDYDLDGKLTLNERAIEKFAEICVIESVQQKIRRLESEEETYKLLGNYWLELADCYYETSQYQKCLDCVGKYNDMATGIYRKDNNYVRILPKAIAAAQAIVAAQEIYSNDAYITNIEAFADAIFANTTTEEWSIRYFAAQVYLDLYARTNDRAYLEAAYDIAYDNIVVLLDEQRALNATYLADVKKVQVSEPDYKYMTKAEKKDAEQNYKTEQKRLKAYNKGLEETRKSELPTLYEPFILNCDLLFALADKMGIRSSEKSEIEAILQTDNNGVFLTDPINDRYSFSESTDEYSIEFNKDKVVIPVVLLMSGSDIVITVTDKSKTTTFDDCVVTKVERKGATIESYYASIESDKMNGYTWSENSKVTVTVSNRDENTLTFRFKVVEFKDNWIFSDKVVFEEE